MNYTIEIDHEEDGRIIAEIKELPGVLVYGETEEEAIPSGSRFASALKCKP